MAAIEHEWIIYSVELLSRRRAWVVFVETVDEQHVGIVCTMTMDVDILLRADARIGDHVIVRDKPCRPPSIRVRFEMRTGKEAPIPSYAARRRDSTRPGLPGVNEVA